METKEINKYLEEYSKELYGQEFKLGTNEQDALHNLLDKVLKSHDAEMERKATEKLELFQMSKKGIIKCFARGYETALLEVLALFTPKGN